MLLTCQQSLVQDYELMIGCICLRVADIWDVL